MTAYAHISNPSASLAKGLLRNASGNPAVDLLVCVFLGNGAHSPEQDYRCDMS
jgi:hypothetical protein